MGTFSVPIRLQGRAEETIEVAALVDTGAPHTLVGRDVLARLGVESTDRVTFLLADERQVEYEVGEVRVRLDGRERTILVVFGPVNAAPLLGATTLELFNLAADPVRQRLISVPGLLK